MPSEASGPRPLFGGTGRAFSLEVASFALTFKFSEAPEALGARIFARSGPTALNFGSPGRSRARFWRPERLDLRSLSTLAHGRCVQCPRPTKHCVGARISSFELLHDTTKTTQNHSASVLNSARCTKCARGPLQSRLGASQDPPVEIFGWFHGAFGPPRMPQDAPRSIPGPYFGIPDLSRARSRTSSERTQPPKINLASMLAPFSVIFEVFSSNFARAACDECTKSDSQKGVA